uniref:Transcription factor TFIIIC triple barrel domain-containing protein n=1 Tax=Oryzias sinensis TaxID=183150 RepID=A0A8C7YAN5_9TELE
MVLPVQLEFFLGRECQAAPAATKPVQELSEVQPPSTSTAFTQEQLVVVELSGIIDNELLTKNRGTCKILDIDSEKPMMQIGHYVFAGKYEDALGTCVLFEEVPQKENSSKAPDLKYMCQTVKKLTMERIFLMEKKEGETNTGLIYGLIPQCSKSMKCSWLFSVRNAFAFVNLFSDLFGFLICTRTKAEPFILLFVLITTVFCLNRK